ncbi:MAG: hypothetical protein ABSF34_03405 [Verrucomicrobiota bacterium]|jgi:hypothetical protein
MDTAKPALLSAGVVIDEPEDNSDSALLNALLDWLSNVAVFIADVFVLITMLIMNSFLESPREGPFLSGTTSMLCWRAFIQAPAVFLPAVCGRRTPWLHGFIGGNRQHFNRFLIFLAHPKEGDADFPRKGHIVASHMVNERQNIHIVHKLFIFYVL